MVFQFPFCIFLFLPITSCLSLRGVDPAIVSYYHHEVFSCFDGSNIIRLEFVNDDFCDCIDGSDEPGTSACPSGSFYCANAGFEPRRIPSSFVDDGICDCCDGSDESSISCENSCAQLGQKRKQELLKETEQYQTALQEKKNRLKGIDNVKEKWKTELEDAKKEVKIQQEKCDVLKQELDKLEAEKRRIAEENKATKNDSSTDNTTTTTAEDEEDQKQDSNHHEDSNTLHEEKSKTGDDDEADTDVKTKQDIDDRLDDENLGVHTVDESELLDDDSHSYDDQMDHDDSDHDYSDQTEDAHGYHNYDDQEKDDQRDEVEDKHKTSTDSKTTERMISFLTPLWQRLMSLFGRSGSKMRGQDSTKKTDLHRFRKEHSEQRRELSTLKEKVKNLEKKIENDYGPNSTFLSLVDKCFDLTQDKYTYEICPFEKSSQKEGRSSISLGSWSGFDDDYKWMKFEGGQRCAHGRNRKLDVYLLCGVEDRVLTVMEPDMCEYSANFSTPTVCMESELNELTNRVRSVEKLIFEIKDEL
eukprot:g6578.t1